MKPRSAPGGSRERREPLADSRRVAWAGPKSRRRFPGGSSPAEAAPSPGLASRPKPLRSPFRKPLGRSRPAFRGTPRGRNLPKSPFGSRLRPKALPLSRKPASKAEASSMNPRFRLRLGPKPFPVSLPARAAGRFPRPSPVRRAFQLQGAFRRRHGRFREIPTRIRFRLWRRGFVRLPAFRVRRRRPWGSDSVFCLGSAAFGLAVRFRSVALPATT